MVVANVSNRVAPFDKYSWTDLTFESKPEG